MIVATDKRMTLQAFLEFEGGDDLRYELVDGVLVEMNLGTGKHGGSIRRLAKYLEAGAVAMGTDWIAIQGLVGIETTIGTRGDRVRIPDVTLMSEAQWSLIEERSGWKSSRRMEPKRASSAICQRWQNSVSCLGVMGSRVCSFESIAMLFMGALISQN